MSEPLLAPTFLFRFSVPCRRREAAEPGGRMVLGPEHVLPSFGELEGRPVFADLRAAWNEHGLWFVLSVRGKRQTPWCRPSRAEDSDGLHLCIDTRDIHNVHRATRFCHRFVFSPTGAGPRRDQPFGRMVPIPRARELPAPWTAGAFGLESQPRRDGYVLQIQIPAGALTGFDPSEHPRLGFTYAVIDRELGWQTFTLGPEFPFLEDPSLWGTLELVRYTPCG